MPATWPAIYVDLRRAQACVLPYRASLIAQKNGNKLYCYAVESRRIGGKPRIVHQAYLGSAEKAAELIRERSAPLPLSASMRQFGLPAALWQADFSLRPNTVALSDIKRDLPR
ncbi:MAG: hypothetical protein ACLGSH_03970 [Acidobacteriota bacterium]